MLSYKVNVNYEVVKPLDNQGCNSKVFRIRDKQLNSEFVLKKIEKASLDINQLFHEAQILKKCDHPNVAKIQYAGEDSDKIHIDLVMPFYANGSLKEKVTNGNYLSTIDAIRYFIHIFQGLSHIHSQGLIHFDIKPDNIMISDSDEALVADFGLAKYMENYGIQPDKMYSLHTQPELYVGSKVADYRADIYQAGLTMYRIVNGYDVLSQYRNLTIADILSKSYPSRSNYKPHIPLKLKQIINKCIEPNPNDRYKSVIEVINELSSIPKKDILYWSLTHDTTNLSIWEQIIGNKKIQVRAAVNSSEESDKYVILTKKISLNSHKEQKIKEFCYNGNRKNEFESKLKTIFK